MGGTRIRALAPATVAAVVAVASVALGAGCSATVKQVDTSKIEQAIGSQFSKQGGTPITNVSCPDTVDAKKGDVFTCTATFQDGDQEPVKVTQTDDHGHVLAKLVNLPVTSIQNQIKRAFGRQGLNVSAECPVKIAERKGNDFTCTITSTAGDTAKVAVTQLDDSGRVRFKLVRR